MHRRGGASAGSATPRVRLSMPPPPARYGRTTSSTTAGISSMAHVTLITGGASAGSEG